MDVSTPPSLDLAYPQAKAEIDKYVHMFCNTPDVTFHICNSNSCHFRLCVMLFPPWLGFCFSFCILFMSCISYHVIMCIAFAYVFVFCIRAFSPLSILQSGTPTSSGASLLFLFVSGC